MNKFILGLFFIAFSLLSEESKIKFNYIDGSSKMYYLSEIDSINLKGTNNQNTLIIYEKNESKSFKLNENSNLTFAIDMINLTVKDSILSFKTSEIDSMIFKSEPNPKSIEITEIVADSIILNTSFPNPWSIEFLNNNEMLITEKSGTLYKVNNKTGKVETITGTPIVNAAGQGGLLDVVLHPDFKTNNFVYLSYTVSGTGGQVLAMGRGELSGTKLINYKELFKVDQPISGQNNQGSRIVFDDNKYLFLAVGDRFTPNFAQDTNSYLGKILRFNDDGTIPTDNPFYGIAKKKWEIWSLGHRNIQGMAINPNTRELWAHEHGPKGGDELNLIKKGANYGWPKATFGVNYDGTIISKDTTLPGYEDPIMHWVPSIAPCGMTFVKYNYPTIEQDILMGALAGTQIVRIKIKDNKAVKNIINMKGYARFRDIKQAPDGTLYAVMEGPSRLVRLKMK